MGELLTAHNSQYVQLHNKCPRDVMIIVVAGKAAQPWTLCLQ